MENLTDVVKIEKDPLECDVDSSAVGQSEPMNQDGGGGAFSDSATEDREPLGDSESKMDTDDKMDSDDDGRILCVICGVSLLKKTRYYLHEQSNEKKRLIINEIKEITERVSAKLVTELDCCCYACWASAKRAVEDRTVAEHVCKNPEAQSEPEPETSKEPQIFREPTTIILPHYKRAPIRKPCFYYNCNSTTGRLVPRSLRLELLMEYNYYLPARTLACEAHITFHTWETLESLPNNKSTFSTEHVEDILKMLKNGISKKQPKIAVLPAQEKALRFKQDVQDSDSN